METETDNPKQPPQSSAFTVPMAIVVAGALIAGAVFFSNQPSPAQTATATNSSSQKITVKAIQPDEHYLGNPNADIVFIEFSDLECPYCKQFHPTMNDLILEYGKQGIMAWAYRHYPLVEKHPKAVDEAHATECVAELGGNQAFWNMINAIYTVTPANNQLDLAILPRLARDAGVTDMNAYNTCQASKKYSEKIQNDLKDAIAAGGNGTPHTVVLFKKPLSKKTRESIVTAVTAEFKKIYPNAALPSDIMVFDESGDKMSFYGQWPRSALTALIETAVPSAKQQ